MLFTGLFDRPNILLLHVVCVKNVAKSFSLETVDRQSFFAFV